MKGLVITLQVLTTVANVVFALEDLVIILEVNVHFWAIIIKVFILVRVVVFSF